MDSLHGLSSNQAKTLLAQIGPNTITEHKTSFFKKTLHWLTSPMSLLLIAASALSFADNKIFDGWFIAVLFVFNFAIAQWHEAKADNAISSLQQKLSIKAQTKRDGQWRLIESSLLVPGDIVQLGVGNVVPADVQIAECKNVGVNESVLTGESLPSQKTVDDIVFTGSFLTEGSLTGTVKATGERTKFGKTVTMVESHPKNSLLESDILTISKYLMVLGITAATVSTAYLMLQGKPLSDLLQLDLSILIAGVPVAMPTVMTLIISLGVLQLTRKRVIVRRLSSLEDLANVNMLLSDKTGTLTQNEIQIENIITYNHVNDSNVIRYAASATTDNQLDPINQAILTKALKIKVAAFKQLDFTPADSKRKRSTAIIEADGKQIVSLGAPQIIEGLCKLDKHTKDKFNQDIEQAASNGQRSLALAIGSGTSEKNLKLVGILLLSDTLRPDAKQVIGFLAQHGISTKIMTGDNRAIAARVARQLGLNGNVMVASGKTGHLALDQLHNTDVFAEVLPDDKFRIVQTAAKGYTVAATGDGVNDLPALKVASVGIAVKNAVDALKSAADIILMTDGISVIRNAIIEARKIFMRTYYYSVYRISESSRLIISIAILSIIYGDFPITPVQIILLALLNDLPIITLAYDRVKISTAPSVIKVRQRFAYATMLGLIGVATSVTFFWLVHGVMRLPMSVVQTMFFLKLAVSGHMLVYVAHTKHIWWRWLPSKSVIWATTLTQIFATIIAMSGLLFQQISIDQALLVWGWAFAWMQVTEICKQIFLRRSSI
jgi:H+-transporting ATPase